MRETHDGEGLGGGIYIIPLTANFIGPKNRGEQEKLNWLTLDTPNNLKRKPMGGGGGRRDPLHVTQWYIYKTQVRPEKKKIAFFQGKRKKEKLFKSGLPMAP